MKKNIFKIVMLVLAYALFCGILYYILKLNGLTNITHIRDCVSNAGIWGYVIFFVCQIMLSTFICILPFEDELLTGISIILFGTTKGFFIAVFNMFVTSMLQFLMGRYLCRSLIEKLLGDKSIQNYQNYLKTKGEIMLPILYLIPLLPHDSLCVLAGMSKMKIWYFAPVTLVMRSIEIVSICFLSSGIINFSLFEIHDWIFAINILIIDIYLIIKLKNYIDNKINKK